MADALQVDGSHAEALELLGLQARTNRGDPRVFEMQARRFAATGRTMSRHQALGEYYALLSGAQTAMEQFQIARCAGGGRWRFLLEIDRTAWASLIPMGCHDSAGRLTQHGNLSPQLAEGIAAGTGPTCDYFAQR